MRSSKGLLALALAAGLLGSAAAANAQNQRNQPQSEPSSPPPTGTPGQSSPGPSANIPDNKLDAAAAAVKSVSAVKDDYEQRVAKAPEGEKARIVDEANKALTKAVTDQGLSVAEYTSILQVAQNDAVIRDKILQRLK